MHCMHIHQGLCAHAHRRDGSVRVRIISQLGLADRQSAKTRSVATRCQLSQVRRTRYLVVRSSWRRHRTSFSARRTRYQVLSIRYSSTRYEHSVLTKYLVRGTYRYPVPAITPAATWGTYRTEFEVCFARNNLGCTGFLDVIS